MSSEYSNKISFDISGQDVEIEITIAPDATDIRYKLTSKETIEPLDAALCLWLIIKSMCKEVGITADEFLKGLLAADNKEDLQ